MNKKEIFLSNEWLSSDNTETQVVHKQMVIDKFTILIKKN
jgi:hypothetical protein